MTTQQIVILDPDRHGDYATLIDILARIAIRVSTPAGTTEQDTVQSSENRQAE